MGVTNLTRFVWDPMAPRRATAVNETEWQAAAGRDAAAGLRAAC